jgi:hypothetical protein
VLLENVAQPTIPVGNLPDDVGLQIYIKEFPTFKKATYINRHSDVLVVARWSCTAGVEKRRQTVQGYYQSILKSYMNVVQILILHLRY